MDRHEINEVLQNILQDIESRQIDQVEDAGLMYMECAELSRVGDRGKRRAKKQLQAFDPGTYGGIQLVMRQVNREYPDIDAIRETYARLGLGPVPMRPAEATLSVEFAPGRAGTVS